MLASIGMLPGTFLYVYLGMTAGSLAALGEGTPARGPVYWIFLGFGLVAAVLVSTLLGRIAGRALGGEDLDEMAAEEREDG